MVVPNASGDGTDTITVPVSAVGGSQIIVHGLDGDDTLPLDLQNPFSHTMVFNGGGAGHQPQWRRLAPHRRDRDLQQLQL